MHISSVRANKKNYNSPANTRRPQTQQAIYGLCHRCNSPISIPGLEAFKCSGECGWVSRKVERAFESHGSVQFITIDLAPVRKSEVSLPVRKSEVSLLELIGRGGEA